MYHANDNPNNPLIIMWKEPYLVALFGYKYIIFSQQMMNDLLPKKWLTFNRYDCDVRLPANREVR